MKLEFLQRNIVHVVLVQRFFLLSPRVVNGGSPKPRKLQTNEGLEHIEIQYRLAKKDMGEVLMRTKLSRKKK